MAETDQAKPRFWHSLGGALTVGATVVGTVLTLLTFLGFHNSSPSGSSISSASSPSSASPAQSSSSVSSPDPAPTPVVSWPAYPGRADVGVAGAVALSWQEILIRCGALSDIPQNRDGIYGTATGEKVEQIESHWGWQDANTEADRLTYNRIVATGCN